MAYTKTNWQTGDTITASALNNAEAGIENAQWKTETSTQLFSETVTTTAGQYRNMGTLSYSDAITADSLTVTFNGTEYICQKVTLSGVTGAYYGGMGENGPDFSEYPFVVCSGDENVLFTETAGTYTVSASGVVTTYTDKFKETIIMCGTLKVVNGTKVPSLTYAEMSAEFAKGKPVSIIFTDSNNETRQYWLGNNIGTSLTFTCVNASADLTCDSSNNWAVH